MTSIEFGKKCKELNKQYKELFGYVPCPADYVVSVSQDEYFVALKMAVKEKRELEQYIKKLPKETLCEGKRK